MKLHVMNVNSLIRLVFILLTLQLSACSAIQIGQKFNVQLFATKAKIGVTTNTQVQAWLGSPNSTGVSVDKDGEQLDEWMYFNGRGTLPKMADTKLTILQVRFNKLGVLTSYNWSDAK